MMKTLILKLGDMNSPILKPGDYAILLAEPWNRHVNQCQQFLRDKLEDMIWWGYRVESVNGNRAVIASMTAPEPVRETVPIECLTKVESVKKAEPVKRPTVTAHPVGARVMYLENLYTIESVEVEGSEHPWSEEPVYNLKAIVDQKLVWQGDRVWHSLIDIV